MILTHTISIFEVLPKKNNHCWSCSLDRSIFQYNTKWYRSIYIWMSIWYVIQTIELWSNKNAICNRTVWNCKNILSHYIRPQHDICTMDNTLWSPLYGICVKLVSVCFFPNNFNFMWEESLFSPGYIING